jgi:hypothetical protein
MVSMNQSLVAFSESVYRAIAQVPQAGRFGTRKVFVSAIWDAMPEAERARQNLDSFKAQLFAAHRAQLLSLARADLVAAMPAAAVAASEIEPARGVTFHFVVIDRCQPMFA